MAYEAPFAFAAGSQDSLASSAADTTSLFATAASFPFTIPSSGVPAPPPSSIHRVPAVAACRTAETRASPESTSA